MLKQMRAADVSRKTSKHNKRKYKEPSCSSKINEVEQAAQSVSEAPNFSDRSGSDKFSLLTNAKNSVMEPAENVDFIASTYLVEKPAPKYIPIDKRNRKKKRRTNKASSSGNGTQMDMSQYLFNHDQASSTTNNTFASLSQVVSEVSTKASKSNDNKMMLILGTDRTSAENSVQIEIEENSVADQPRSSNNKLSQGVAEDTGAARLSNESVLEVVATKSVETETETNEDSVERPVPDLTGKKSSEGGAQNYTHDLFDIDTIDNINLYLSILSSVGIEGNLKNYGKNQHIVKHVKQNLRMEPWMTNAVQRKKHFKQLSFFFSKQHLKWTINTQ